MFDFVHNNKRLIQVALAIIILPFAFWGVDSYKRSGNAAGVIATVEGEQIFQQELNDALRQQQDRLRQMLGEQFDPKMLDDPEMQRAVLDNLISQRLLIVKAREARLDVTDEQVARVIDGIDAFRKDGVFDKTLYENVLERNNMSPLMFETRLRNELLGQQIRDGYLQNGFSSVSVADGIIRLYEQQRLVSVSHIPYQSFISQAGVDEADVKKYYEQNQNEFRVQEQARVEYVKLSADQLLSGVDATAEDAHKYYAEHQAEFVVPEERHAAHILIAAGAAQAEQDKARSKAELLLKQVNQNPGQFADLAKLNSQDPGSAANGGDLGSFGRGMMVKPFDDAVFSMKPGEISGLVKTDFGYHIIKLIGVKPSRALSFDEVRESVVSKLRQQKASEKFAELAEKFSNTVYEQSDTLQPAAALAGVKIEQSGWLLKGKPEGEPWTEKMLQAVFTEDVLKNKRNSAVIEVAPNTLVAARLIEHKSESQLPLDEARELIRKKLQQQHAMELAAGKGKAMLAELQGGGKPVLSWDGVQSISRNNHPGFAPEVVRRIFGANVTSLPQYVGVDVPGTGYIIVRIDAVKEVEGVDDVKRANYVQQLRQMSGAEMFQAYLKEAHGLAKIEVN